METAGNLTIESSVMKPVVEQLVGTPIISLWGNSWDPWPQAFDRQWRHPRVLDSLDAVIQNVGEAIGRLNNKDWLNEALDYTQAKNPANVTRAKVFVAHDGPSDLKDKLEVECWRNGLEPLIVEEAVSLDESVGAKVDRGLEGTAFAIVLARLNRGIDQDGPTIPMGDIIDEISRIRNSLGDRYIILLEEGLSLPTNLAAGVVFEHFSSEHFDSVILKVYKCLHSNGLL